MVDTSRYYIKKVNNKFVIKDRRGNHKNVATFTIIDTLQSEDIYKAIDFSELICNYLNSKFSNV